MRREAIALTFAFGFPSAAAAIYFVVLGGPPTADAGNRAMQVAYGTAKTIQFSFPIVYLLLVEPSAFRTLRLTRQGVRLGILFGLLVGIVIAAVEPTVLPVWFSELPKNVRRKVAEFGVSQPARYAMLATFLSVVHSFLEEYYWRWFLFGRLRKLVSFRVAAVISGVGFMGHHVFVLCEYLPEQFWSGVVPFSFAIAIGGIVWAWLYERTGSLLGPWISHFLVDAALMWVGYRMVFSGS
ncbi:MAG: CPBP family intramembrane glutamic endopeptidase [Gemmataceae bacterium]